MIIDAFDVIDSMAALTRYSQAHNITRESVLEHTAFVALFSASICSRVKYDPSVVLKRAIVHDIDEIVTGDIPTPTKYANETIRNAIYELEKENAKDSIDMLLLGDEYYDHWDNAKDNTLDGQIITISDISAVVYKMFQEAKLGNKTMLKYRNRVMTALAKCSIDFDERLHDIIGEIIDILEDIK